MARCGWCWNEASTTTDSDPCVYCGRVYPWSRRGAAPHIPAQDVDIDVGSTQTVSLLGPFRVNWNDVSTTDPPNTLGQGYRVSVADLPQGCTIIKTWAETVTEFTGFVVGGLAIVVGPPTGAGRVVSVWSGTTSGQTNDTMVVSEQMPNAGIGGNHQGYRIVGADAQLGAAWFEDDGLPDTGSADIYALIATPS